MPMLVLSAGTNGSKPELSFPQICVELSGPGEGLIKLFPVILQE
jgi:hypothetical protein